MSVLPFYLYLANSARNVGGTVSQISPAGVVNTYANVSLTPEGGLAFDANGNLYVGCSTFGRILKFTPSGTVSTFASGFGNPQGLAFDGKGNLYVANQISGTISKITPAGVVSTFASGLSSPTGLAFAGNGNLYVACGNKVSTVTPAGVVSTFAGGFQLTGGIAFDTNGNLYLANRTGTISEVTPAGVVSTFASELIDPQGLAFDGSGNLYVTANQNLYQITSAGVISQLATGVVTSAMTGTTAYLTIISAPIAPPTVTTQPQSQTLAASQNVTFTVSASGGSISNTFQWQRLPASGSTWGNLTEGGSYSGSASPTLTVFNATASMTGDQYQCIVTNIVGNTTTNPAMLTVNPPAMPPVTPVASFGAWQNLWFTPSQLNNSTVSTALAMPAKDGVANLVKYAFNLDPFRPPGSGVNPQLPQPEISNGNLVLTINATQSDITYTIQASTDLIHW